MAEEKLPNLAEEINAVSAYPMYFGVSCAFIALQFLSAMDGPSAELGRQKDCFEEIMLRGSAQLLGLLFEKVQRRHEQLFENERKAVLEVMELKQIRAEDAKANEKVMSIFAAREQGWQAERRRLLNQIQSLSRELSLDKLRNEKVICDLKKRVLEEQQAMKIKDRGFEEEAKKRMDLEEKLRAAQKAVEELREKAHKEVEDHVLELRRQKTAVMELVSNKRQLEVELERLLRQADTAKQELEEVFEQKEEAAAMLEKLSEEFVKVQKDAEQKGKIVSAMLRKAKHDTAEKQALLKELKITRAKKKQAELEAERWKSACEAKQKKSSREMHSAEAGSSRNRVPELKSSSKIDLRTRLLDYLTTENISQHEFPMEKVDRLNKPMEFQVQYLDESDDNLDNVQELQDWVQLEAKKYTDVLEQKHFWEMEAFLEQLRLRDEKLEALHWRLLSTELDSKRLQSHIEGLDGNLTQLRDENHKLEALLMDRESELKSLKERFCFHGKHFQGSSSLPDSECILPHSFDSLMKVATREFKKDQSLYEVEKNIQEEGEMKDVEEIVLLRKGRIRTDVETTICNVSFPSTGLSEDRSNDEILYEDQTVGREVEMGLIHSHIRHNSLEDAFVTISSKLASDGKPYLKMDLQALGVSFKIKRLKQQLLILENLAGTRSSDHETDKSDSTDGTDEKKVELKGLILVISLLDKQLRRYQSLEDKIDALSRRMLENSGIGASQLPVDAGTKKKIDKLEQFLEETFQLQRYMVATGQKFMELQSKINSCHAGAEGQEESAGFNLEQFLDVVRTLFKEVQRGLEVRIARIIGDLEGTLASDGILRR
ncbi:interaptin [Phalaenopsis equestris]|uniref:interaptin n=1 Tax=Phalaenopsis equestris TaxID=78828 RepID=UPI0009E3CB6E|nr:interaptin [Phalaenopsis equestris]